MVSGDRSKRPDETLTPSGVEKLFHGRKPRAVWPWRTRAELTIVAEIEILTGRDSGRPPVPQ